MNIPSFQEHLTSLSQQRSWTSLHSVCHATEFDKEMKYG